MVKRNPPRNRRVPGIELFMECTEEPLSASQVTAQQVARYQYDQAIAKIRDAQAKARVGKATIINKVDTVGKVTPQVPQRATPQKVISSPSRKEPERSSSPDIIFVGETPPSKPKQPVQQQPQPRSLVVTSRSPNVPPVNGHQPKTSVSQQVYKLVTNNSQWVMKPIANVAPQQQTVQRPGQGQYGQPVGGTYGMGYKRPLNVPYQQDQVAKKKPKKNNENEPTVQKRFYESDDSGNWVPLDEYYYGKMEGEPTYEEEKGEFRFKCWYCNKMLYNNVKAMMHIQGHIDSSKQQNIDLSDLTQCKHCYKQFDTPFEMQTHVDKVHMSNTNVLLCRICDRDHESRNALTHHMRMHHNACEMPYTCQLCKFRSSMYSDVVDHFKKKHDSSQHLLCLYCLRVFVVKFVSQGWGTTQTYYGHLLKHQSKAQNKKCGLCRLAFFNAQEVKAHKLKHHGPNQKAVLGTAAHSSKPDQVLIKIPSSSQNKHCVKSLNAPAVSKVLDFGGTTFPGEVHYYNCFECKMSMGTHDHYRKYVECSMCRFATICSIAYANHMMGFHSGQMSSLNLNIPWERKMSKPMYCLCGFSSSYGNKIANHLVFCMKSSCYENRPEGGYEVQKEEEESDPRHKPGASLLDALGLVKRRTVTPMYGRSDDHSPPKVDKSPPKEEVKPKPSPWDPEPIPPELQGSRKWSTVRLKDSNTPTKESVFLGDGSKDKEPVTMDTDDLKEKGISEKGDNSDKQTYGIMGEETDRLKGDNSVSEMIDEDKLLEMDNENKSAEKQSDETNDEKTDDLLEEEELLKDKSDEKDEIDNDNVHKEDVQKDDEKLTENNCQLNDKDENNKTVEKESDQNESVTEDSEPTAKSNSPLGEETVLETESTSQEHSEHIEDDESSSIKDVKSADDEESLLLNDNQAVEDSSQKEDETGELSQNKVETEQFLQKGETEESSQKDGETVKSSQKDDETEESSQKDGETEESLQKDGETEESSQKDGETEESSQKDGKTGESSQKDDETEESSQKDGETEESLQKDDETEESLQKEGETGESSSPVESTENKDTESQHKTDETKSEEKEDKDGEPDMESDKQDNVKEGGVSAESTSGEMEQDSHEEIRAENTNTNSDEQSVDKGDNSETTKQENEESAKADNSKDLGHGDTSRDYHGNKSHDQRSYDDHRSRSHDHRSYEDHRSRSHDHRSYDDRRSHDRNHYDDRRHYDRQDDRNRYRRQDDRNYDRGYHDNRGYRDHRDNRDYHRDDRRHNRGQGSYQGHGGYGGGYHGYR